MLTRCMHDPFMSKLLCNQQASLRHDLPLGAYLLKPVQRIFKYQLLLQVSSSNICHFFRYECVFVLTIDTNSWATQRALPPCFVAECRNKRLNHGDLFCFMFSFLICKFFPVGPLFFCQVIDSQYRLRMTQIVSALLDILKQCELTHSLTRIAVHCSRYIIHWLYHRRHLVT